jgi:hypothetical protein
MALLIARKLNVVEVEDIRLRVLHALPDDILETRPSAAN